MQKIIVFGASGHAKVVIDILEKSGRWEIVGIVDGKQSGAAGSVFGHDILGADEDLPGIVEKMDVVHGIIAVGDNFLRNRIHQKILNLCPGFKFGTAVHPDSSIARGVTIGDGTVIMAGAVINSDAKVGRFCIVNTNASLDHDSHLDDFASLAPGAVLGGNVTVGPFSAVSLGAMVKHGVTIGGHAVVGAGSIVMRDVPGLSVSYGQPCRFVRSRKPGDSYL